MSPFASHAKSKPKPKPNQSTSNRRKLTHSNPKDVPPGGEAQQKMRRVPTIRTISGLPWTIAGAAKPVGYGDFLPWLEKEAGARISSKLYIDKSEHGRSLFAATNIKAGECILRVPYDVQLASENLLPEVEASLNDKVGSVSKLALALLVEQQTGPGSRWAPYIDCLPKSGAMQSTIFWKENELKIIQRSSLYEETLLLKSQIEEDYLMIKPAFGHFREISNCITSKDFMHAHAVVRSRAWGRTKGVSLIPFADFLNHDGLSEAVVLNDEEQRVSEVFADRNFAPGEEVLICYGKLPNVSLLLDFGFTLPCNTHDQVHIRIKVPQNDWLWEMKLEMLKRSQLRNNEGGNNFKSSWDLFTIKEVKSASGKGKGLPQSLRASARIMRCQSPEELSDLVVEAAKTDGRLARRPLEPTKEAEAHQILLRQINQLLDEYTPSIELLEPTTCCYASTICGLRRQMALDLLCGERRILESASAWLKSYCDKLLGHSTICNVDDCG